MNTDFLIIGIIIFIWLLTAWESFYSLTPGRIRRLEADNKELVKKLESWLNLRDEFNFVFRYLSLILITAIGLLLFVVVKEEFPVLNFYEICGRVLLIILILLLVSSLMARLVLKHLDIFFMRITLPLVHILSLTVFWPLLQIVKITDVRTYIESDEEKTSTEDEIMSLVEHDNSENGERLEEDEKRMIRGIFDLDDTLVREIMTPRVDMSALPIKASLEEAKRTIVQSGHSRIPIYGKNVDEIKGIIYAKDFLDEEKPFESLADFMHTPLFVPETKNVGDLLEEFQNNKIHVAIIIDEYGGTAGVVTLEDIIEEIVGEIHDEYDTNEDENNNMRLLENDIIHAEGRCLISDINHEFDLDIPEDEDVDTIAGYVCGEFGKIPQVNEEIAIENIGTFKILKADRRKVLLVEIRKKDAENEKNRE
jgi:CBS domain containing-hemolysin-like protein